jgi:glucose-1-phosphate thymidylyltransferase
MIVIAGDNLLSFDVAEFVDFFEEKGTPCLAAYDVGSKERAKSYGLVELDGDRVVDFQEKPDDPKSTLVSIACYAFPAETLPKFDEYLEDGNNPDEPGWFLQWLQNRGDVHAFTFDGAWFDIGTAESYLDAVSWYLDGENFVHDTATVTDSELGENVYVMENSVVEHSTLERSVIFRDSTIRDADIRGTIVDEDTHIENLDLSNALIGAHSHLE